MAGEDAGNDGDSTFTTESEQSLKDYESSKDKVALLAKSLSNFERVEIDRIRGGSYNRVVLARCTRKPDNFVENLLSRINETKIAATLFRRLPLLAKFMNGRGTSVLEGVFRIPRDSDACDDDDEKEDIEPNGVQDNSEAARSDREVLDQVAALQFLVSHTIPVPKLLAFDATAANPINSPYVFQEYSDGTPLHKIYDDMTLSEKLSIVDAVVEFLISMERIGFAKIGALRANRSPDEVIKSSYLGNSKGATLELAVEGFGTSGTSPPREKIDSYDSITEFFSRQLSAWYEADLEDGENVITDMWKRLYEIFEEMQSLGFFSSPSNESSMKVKSILYHWDLEPRNILVKRKETSSSDERSTDDTYRTDAKWMIDRVIDWDRVLAVPPILARKPPKWMWDFTDEDIYNSARASISSGYDGDFDLLRPSRYNREGGRLSSSDQQIKDYFEESFTSAMVAIYDDYGKETYQEEAYGKGRWIRRLARYAVHGADDSMDEKRFRHFDAEWSEARSQYAKI